MSRLNLTLDADAASALERHARRERKPQSALARELILEAIHDREARARQKRLADDYLAGRADAAAVLDDLERAQLGLLETP